MYEFSGAIHLYPPHPRPHPIHHQQLHVVAKLGLQVIIIISRVGNPGHPRQSIRISPRVLRHSSRHKLTYQPSAYLHVQPHIIIILLLLLYYSMCRPQVCDWKLYSLSGLSGKLLAAEILTFKIMDLKRTN